MIDVYIWIAVWVVIIIMLIISLMKIEDRIAEDRINKMFEHLKERKKERLVMAKYINADDFKQEMEKYLPEDRELALKVLKSIKTADEEKIATEYCMKRCLVMITMDTYETLIAYYNRINGL